jgi:protein SCO1
MRTQYKRPSRIARVFRSFCACVPLLPQKQCLAAACTAFKEAVSHTFALGALRGWLIALAVLALFGIGLSSFAAEPPEPPPPGFEGATVIEKPDAQVPLDVEFFDEDGNKVRLAEFFGQGRPVIVVMVYFRCPTICNLTLNGLVEGLRPLKLVPGKDYEIVTVSFDTREGPELARAKKENYLKLLGKPEAASAWHFLTHPKEAPGRALGDALGFGYKLDAKGQNYLHQAAIYLCTPDGRVSRTIQGVKFEPDVLRDSLVFASEGKRVPGLLGFALSCGLASYDHATGKYTWAAMAIVRITGILTVVILASAIGTMVYRDTRKKAGGQANRPQETANHSTDQADGNSP